MLVLDIGGKETEMSEQLFLFEPPQRRWIARLWRRLGPHQRRQALALLAEMARGSLRKSPKRGGEGRSDES